jgi:Nickel/cobalt transporter regulator
MKRALAVAAMVGLVLPGLAVAQEHHEERHAPPQHGAPQHLPPPHAAPQHPPPPHGTPLLHAPTPYKPPPPPHKPPPVPPLHPGLSAPPPHGGPTGPHVQFMFHGHAFHSVPFPHPFVYPRGWAYRRWVVGAILPPLFLVPEYYFMDWAALGLPPPPPGDEWVQYGPDLLLVDVATGEVVEVVYGVFY